MAIPYGAIDKAYEGGGGILDTFTRNCFTKNGKDTQKEISASLSKISDTYEKDYEMRKESLSSSQEKSASQNNGKEAEI